MNNKNILFNWRFLLILSSAICALVAIVFKILSIQFIDSNFLQNEGGGMAQRRNEMHEGAIESFNFL